MTTRELMSRLRDLTDKGFGDVEVKCLGCLRDVDWVWPVVSSGEPCYVAISVKVNRANDEVEEWKDL